MQTYSAHGYEVLDLAVTDDNTRFVSVGGDRQVFLWDVAQGRTLKRWSGHERRVNCVGFAGEGASVVVSGRWCSVLSVQPMLSKVYEREAREETMCCHYYEKCYL